MSSIQPTDISKVFTSYLGRCRQFYCPICQEDVNPPTLDGFKNHVQDSAANHPTEGKAFLEAFEKMKLSSVKIRSKPVSATGDEQPRQSRKRSRGTAALDLPYDPRNAGQLPSNNTGGSGAKSRNETKDEDIWEEDPSVTQMIRQPETKAICQKQLIAKVKGIYARLVIVKSKCIKVNNA